MNKGVQIYTVRDCIGTKEAYYEALRKIRDMGYNCVQAYATPAVDEMELLAMLNDLGLRDCSVGGDLDAIDQDPSLVKGIVEKAHLFGVNEVSIGTLRKEWRECEEGYHKFAEQVNRVGGLLAKEGLHLMYHSHALEFFALHQLQKRQSGDDRAKAHLRERRVPLIAGKRRSLRNVTEDKFVSAGKVLYLQRTNPVIFLGKVRAEMHRIIAVSFVCTGVKQDG